MSPGSPRFGIILMSDWKKKAKAERKLEFKRYKEIERKREIERERKRERERERERERKDKMCCDAIYTFLLKLKKTDRNKKRN